MASVTIRDLDKKYGTTQVMFNVNLEIEDGDFVVFVGPSGCGKSTLLRMIAGLEEISAGTVSIGENVMNDVAPSKRGVAMVFQTYALYPHMTVYENMSFGLKQINTAPDEITRRVTEAAEVLQITDYLERSPKNLSGGQRQRVAIGRAIVRDPEVFLFDEPLSNLDAALRVQTRLEIARLHERLGATMIYVTHDQVEAMTLADKIVVLRDGRVEQYGAPLKLYNTPDNKFVASFIGSPQMNFFPPSTLDSDWASDLSHLSAATTIGVRPEHMVNCSKEDALIIGKLDLVEELGELSLVHCINGDGTGFVVKMEVSPTVKQGDPIYFNAPSELVHGFTADDLRIA